MVIQQHVLSTYLEVKERSDWEGDYQAFLKQDSKGSLLSIISIHRLISLHRLNQELPLFLFFVLGVATSFTVYILEGFTINNGVVPLAFFFIWWLLWRTRNFKSFRKELYTRWNNTLNGSVTQQQCKAAVFLCQELSKQNKPINVFRYDKNNKTIYIEAGQPKEIYRIEPNGDIKNQNGK